MTDAIKNVACDSRHGDRVALSCEMGGARYHVWMYWKTGVVEDVIYKNPLDDGVQFKTRKQSAKTRPMQAMIKAMLDVYRRDGLLAKLEAKEAVEEKQREARNKKEYAATVKSEAGEDLYDALKNLVRAISIMRDVEKDTDLAVLLLRKIDKKIGE